MKTFIRPVHVNDNVIPVSFALCRDAQRLLTDEDILEHFAPDTPGCDIKHEALTTYGATSCEWATPINA